MTARSADPGAGFHVARWMDRLGHIACDRPAAMRAVARLESKLVEERLAEIPIEAPVWIAGLARSGSTVLLELLDNHPATATQRYRDFPPVLTPFFWNRLLDLMPLNREAPAERAHRDRIMVTAESPEAFEEPVWMNFFPDLHDGIRSAVMDGTDRHAEFEAFLKNHMRKIMLVRGGRRYLAKANYNATRFAYLLAIFPNARFLLPIREPGAHVASLMKQQRLFCAGEADNPAARRHLARAGHFEFGLGRHPIHCGDHDATAEIRSLWAAGREAEGWALQWAALYGAVADQLDADPALRSALLVVRYEDFCAEPASTLGRILDHCGLDPMEDLLRMAKERLSAPSYYQTSFPPALAETIRDSTDAVALRFGYEVGR